jgi:hypothetical protein
MRQYLALQAMESGKGFYMGDRYRMSAYGNGNMLMAPETQPQGKIGEHQMNRFCVRFLTRAAQSSTTSTAGPLTSDRGVGLDKIPWI